MGQRKSSLKGEIQNITGTALETNKDKISNKQPNLTLKKQ